MGKSLLIAARVTALTLLLTGLAYPLLVTGLAHALFPARASGSLVLDDRGRAVASEWIGQSFSRPDYFWSRPSAAGDKGYDAANSSGSNFGPTSKKLRDRIDAERARLAQANPDAPAEIPADLLTASGSGLDPHISPEAARWQIARVAKTRKVAPERVAAIVDELVEPRQLGFLGEPRVNVVLLNLALDRRFGDVR